jgi:hypothetical protein
MTHLDEPRTLQCVEDLLEVVELVAFETYEIHGVSSGKPAGAELEGRYDIQASFGREDDNLKFRFTLTFTFDLGQYKVDMASVYKLSEPVTIPEAINVEFAERVAFMAVFPFLREHVFGIATRLQHPTPVLGLVRQGGFKLTADEAAPAADL